MSWLAKIDLLYAFAIKDKNNKKFVHYPQVKLDLVTVGVDIIFRKKLRKTQALFRDSYGRIVYLSDVDIINILVESPEKVFFLIHRFFKEYLQNAHQNNLLLEIEKKSFEFGFIIPISTEANREDLEVLKCNNFKTRADFDISYYDLLILISIIVDKEYIVSEFEPEVRKSRQLKKFIILSDFYRNLSYRNELEANGYNVNIPISDVYKNSIVAKKIDKLMDGLQVV